VNRLFDPTAFENMKVVIDGYFYDKDIDGEIHIIDRNDLMNLAKLSREYSIHFQLAQSLKKFTAIYYVKAGLENLAGELLQLPSKREGCMVVLEFLVVHPNEKVYFEKIQEYLKECWGENRIIGQLVLHDPLSGQVNQVENRLSIHFNRLITEDQMDDLLAIGDHMIETLLWLESQL
jgi:hypothetical protein